jgi:translation elongation factor EF-Tu-like GTPase
MSSAKVGVMWTGPSSCPITGRGTVVTGRIEREALIQPIAMEEKG